MVSRVSLPFSSLEGEDSGGTDLVEFVCLFLRTCSYDLEPRREDWICYGGYAGEGMVSSTRLFSSPSFPFVSLPKTHTSFFFFVGSWVYRESFVCVEPGYVSEFFSLDVGKEWVGKMVLRTF